MSTIECIGGKSGNLVSIEG